MDSYDLVCLSHLRWDFVFQRPQQLMSRAVAARRVFFIEEPIIESGIAPYLAQRHTDEGVIVVVPHMPPDLSPQAGEATLRALIDQLFAAQQIERYVLWFWTPMAMGYTHHLAPIAVVYDCMDELSAFKNAPPSLPARERELMRHADVVFTGGHNLYQAKRHLHTNIHPFPSSIDFNHFAQARAETPDPEDQRRLPRPRVGFFGVIDERADLGLIAGIAERRPDLALVMIGPVVKIDPASLPRRPNIHWLGGKSYAELPRYIAGWDVAILPFAINESTRFISPTKTPEYLAAGRPVVSTPIRDVVHPYGDQGLVRIAHTAEEFIAAIDAALAEDSMKRRATADRFLARLSWGRTWAEMEQLIDAAVRDRDAMLETRYPTAAGGASAVASAHAARAK